MEPFSIICTVKDRVSLIRRCVESVLAQDDPAVEFVVQDGGSTDGTLDVLREYGDRLSLRSEPDAGAGEGLFRALRRVTGAYFGCCLSDERLVPDAVSWARRTLAAHPDLGAIYGFADVTDDAGTVLSRLDAGEFDVERLLTYEQVPPFLATFFRMSAYRELGLWDYTGGGELDIWFRAAVRFPIRRVPKLVGYYGMDRAVLSNQTTMYESERAGRLETIRRLFHDDPAGRPFRHLEPRAYAGYYLRYTGNFVRNADWPRAADSLARALGHWPVYGEVALERGAAALASLAGRLAEVGHAAVLEAWPALAAHLTAPSPRGVVALHSTTTVAGERLRAFWLRYVLERPFNVWTLLPGLGIGRVALLGGGGWGMAVYRDLQAAGVDCVAIVENNESHRRWGVIDAPYFSTDAFVASGLRVDAVLSSLQGDHDRDILGELQQRVGATTPVLSWKVLVSLLAREVGDARWPALGFENG